MKINRYLKLMLGLSLLVNLPVVVRAAALPGPGYQYAYDPSTGLLPSDTAMSQPSWAPLFGPPDYTTTSTVANNLLTLSTPAQQYFVYRMGSGVPGGDGQSWNPVAGVGSSIEFTAQVTTANNTAQGMTVLTPTNSYFFAIGVSEVQSFLYGNSHSYDYANTGGFHTYHIDFTTSNTADVFVDNTFAFTTSGDGSTNPSPYMEFGNGTGALDGGTVNYGYFEWTNLGVVPEPSEIALMAMGLLVGGARWRIARRRRWISPDSLMMRSSARVAGCSEHLRKRHCFRRNRRISQTAFTLTELVAVITLITVLMILVFPAISSSLEFGRTGVCIGNQRSITAALILYAGEHGGFLPDYTDYVDSGELQWWNMIASYMGSQTTSPASSFPRCPSATGVPSWQLTYGVNYGAYGYSPFSYKMASADNAWPGSKRLSQLSPQTFLLTDLAEIDTSSAIYHPGIWSLSSDYDHDGVVDSCSSFLPQFPYNHVGDATQA